MYNGLALRELRLRVLRGSIPDRRAGFSEYSGLRPTNMNTVRRYAPASAENR